MDPRYAKLLRWIAILCALIMMMVSGHTWNRSRVDHSILLLFDGMILLLSLCVLAMIMDDAGERRKNINAAVFLTAAIGLFFFVFS